jgi:hypothetical protein
MRLEQVEHRLRQSSGSPSSSLPSGDAEAVERRAKPSTLNTSTLWCAAWRGRIR